MRTLFRRGLRLLGARADATAGTPGDPAARPKPLYVITLTLSPAPLPLAQPPDLPQVGGLSVFRARSLQSGREVHLQQLGFFDSRQAAEALLPALERDYPGAFVHAASVEAMGSLDDTQATEISVLRRALAGSAGATAASQAYVVQLVRQSTPVDVSGLPRDDVFREYTLYRVHAERDGRRTYGLRLGFFSDHHSARLVAEYLRGTFPQATALPISEREYARVVRR